MNSFELTEDALRAKVTEGEGLAAKNAALQGELKGRDAIIADLQVRHSPIAIFVYCVFYIHDLSRDISTHRWSVQTKLEKSKSETREMSGKGEEEAQALLEQERAHFAESRKGFLVRACYVYMPLHGILISMLILLTRSVFVRKGKRSC